MRSYENLRPHRLREIRGASHLFPSKVQSVPLWAIVILVCSALFASSQLVTRANGSAIRNIAIVNYSFRPPSVNITTGTQVVWTFWTNGTDSNDIHTVTANNQTQTGAGVFQSQTLRPGQTFNFTFNYPGKYPYHCAYHNFMTALVTVTGPPLTSPAASNSLVLYLELGAIAAVALAGTFVFYSRKRRKERPNMQS